MTIQALYPDISPSLSLDFANVKQLDPRVTFARASTARYYDGKTVAKAEENLFINSQGLELLTSTGVNKTANATNAPDGTTTATSVTVASGTTTAANVRYTSVSVTATSYAVSVFAKPNGKNWLVIRELLSDGTANDTWFDVENGSVGTTAAGHNATILSFPENFYRCVITFTVNSARTNNVIFYLADSDGSLTVADDGNGLYLWGAQLEQRSTVTAYTATTTQPITNYIPVLLSAADNEARFDHNPTTSESLGLLIEEQRTNLALDSSVFAASNGTNLTSNIVISPTGEQDADFIFEDTSNGEHYSDKTVSVTSGQVYTWSFYVKQGVGNRSIRIRTGGSGAASADLNLSTGVISVPSGAAYINSSVQNVGNGWYRLTLTMTASATGTLVCRAQLVSGAGASYTGDGVSGVYLWGAQLEAGAFPTSYIPTVASQVTRSADAASMTGTNFSSWYRADEGTLYGDVQAANAAQVFYYAVASSGTGNEIRLGTQSNGGNPNFAVTVNFATQASILRSFAAGLRHKIAGSYRTNNFEAAVNGTLGTSDTDGILPTPDRLDIGQRSNGGNVINSHIRKLSYYPKALTAAELQALTQN
jgi:hypothetical protein